MMERKYKNTYSRPITLFLDGDFVTINPGDIIETNHTLSYPCLKEIVRTVKPPKNKRIEDGSK